MLNVSGMNITNSEFVGCGGASSSNNGAGVYIAPSSGQTVEWLFIENTTLSDSGANDGLSASIFR
jgi:hypothetical protein